MTASSEYSPEPLGNFQQNLEQKIFGEGDSYLFPVHEDIITTSNQPACTVICLLSEDVPHVRDMANNPILSI